MHITTVTVYWAPSTSKTRVTYNSALCLSTLCAGVDGAPELVLLCYAFCVVTVLNESIGTALMSVCLV